MPNEAGPNFIGYFKYLTSELLMDNEMLQLPFPEFKKEKLKAIIDDSVDFLTRETDRINDQIIAKLHMELDPSNIEQLSCHSLNSDEIINDRCRKRKVSSILDDNILNQNSVGKVYNDTQALQARTGIGHKDLQKYSVALQGELDKMEQDIEEFLDVIFSKCRAMSSAEKERLGKLIKSLPEKALDRAVDIVRRGGDLSEAQPSDQVFVDLEKQDDATLWRLYYYVHSVLKATKKLSGCSPMPLPLT